MKVLLSIFFWFTFLSFSKYSIAIDTITPNQTLKDNGEALISVSKSFELGFFSPWNSKNRYIGIWFKNIPQQTVVWVANKDNPLTDSSGILTITANGNIVIFNNQSGIPIWSSNSSATSTSPVLQLLDTGNLVVKDDIRSERYLFESFDHPCDTLLPGMKLGWNLGTNQNWFLTSWKSLQDPSTGDYTYELADPRSLPQLILRKGSEIKFRAGPWDGARFGGQKEFQENPVFIPIFVFNATFVYYSFENLDNTTISRFVVNQSGSIEHLSWNERSGEWIIIMTLPNDRYCSNYAMCGPYGICNDTIPICRCPTGFMPIFPQDWNNLVWTDGCVRRMPKNCSADEGFRKFSRVKLPDNSHILANNSVKSPMECEEACLRNCSCVAYATTAVSVCVVWFGSLLDITEFYESGQELYIRMAASELEALSDPSKKKRQALMMIAIAVVSGVLLLVSTIYFIKKKKKKKKKQKAEGDLLLGSHNYSCEQQELPLFDFVTVVTATNNFSCENKLGEGGFGPVYKGKLAEGQEIAVKRLSRISEQGNYEFNNEIILVAKLQHRNLVKLLGGCSQGEERILIYEYMSNKSLDHFIFDPTRSKQLNWRKRLDIVMGIARGLLYLHQDSRLLIIHRDLKTSNILLDSEMNPKISDFGIAKISEGDQPAVKTKRIVGTYGYMSPEYVIKGIFSVKSDVFSFGVVVLEILSGVKNREFCDPDHHHNLLGHAWLLWKEDRPLELMDKSLDHSGVISELLKCMQVGLLCVQKVPEDRPTMSSVVFMLSNDGLILPQPKQPGFFIERWPDWCNKEKSHSYNDVTITSLGGR